ncbi:TonB-dependent receptor [Cellvibrio sp. NN19]|uniref:TonB-dependent receptor n=1 Tax=Cellvibrio chitinivorans TaxID=3102792 RepID=UPI002B4159D6|nr:TonB-dependent receptor [Cellvibrio sp. NN19]
MKSLQHTKKSHTQLALAIALASTSGMSLAQAQNPGSDVHLLEEVIVSGSPIRDSQQAALDAKRNASNAVDMVAADTIGRFPDQNLADSLGRVPGLAIERDQGQARYINFRGAPFRYTSIAFDGIDVPGAENGRVPRFDSFPSVITSSIEANKAVLPSMPGESVAGYVNINTFSPFSKEGFGISADLGTGEQDLGGGDVSKLGLRTSWSNENFGVLLFGSDNSREQVTDNREYSMERDEATDELIIESTDFRSYKVKREDHAYGGRLEYRGDGALQKVFLSNLYSEFVDDEERNQYVFTLDAANGGARGVTGSNVAVGVSRMLQYGEYSNSTNTSTLGADFALGEWELGSRLTYTETTFEMDLPIAQSVAGRATASYDYSDIEDPLLYLNSPLSDIAYYMTLGIHYVQNLDVDSTKFKLDADRDFTWFDQNAKLELGMQLDQRQGDGFVAMPVLDYTFPVSNINSYDTGKPWASNTTNSIGGTYFDNKGLYEAWEATGELEIGEIPDANLIVIDEDIVAAYAMATTDYDWGNFVIGARVEQTDYTSEGTIDDAPVSVNDSFTNVLPSAHLNINLAEDVKFRVSATTGMSRPTYSEWRAAASVDVANKTASGGNPYLKAEETTGFDTSLEWYFADASLLSANAFYRAIDNVIYADSEIVDGGKYLPSAAGEEWEYTGSVNGSDGKLSGVELNFIGQAVDLTEALTGFGISLNAAFLSSEFKGIDGTTYDLPGTSDSVYNASVFYENFGLSARLNYQYRDQWVSPLESPDEVWGEQTRVDFSINYELPVKLSDAAISVYANANNLTDETDVRYAANGLINQSESYGRSFLMGVRVNY